MNRFLQVFKNHFNIIGMIHLQALPGTPNYTDHFEYVVEKAKYEASLYNKLNVDAILIENMNDVPYIQNIGPEIVAAMARISRDIKRILPNNKPCGIQVLASANKHALAISKACDLQFIRAEGFVFSHVADEGWTDACAGQLLRYRKKICADNILIFTDIKKKHSSHAITADTTLLETIKAAELFLSDGVIVTGSSTGDSVNLDELNNIQKCNIPILVGSGCTINNIERYFNKCHAVIVGSHFKQNGNWQNDLDELLIKKFVEKVNLLREKCKL